MKKVKKAIIPAAGMGTRFLPATKAQPKEMLPIIDKPAIQYIVEEAIASGIEEILIINGRNKNSIEDHFDRALELEHFLLRKNDVEKLKLIKDFDIPIYYLRQKDALGLGHAVYTANAFINNEPFAVMLGDDVIDASIPCLKQLIDVYEKTGGSVLCVQEVSDAEISSYGVIKPLEKIEDNIYKVEDLIEKPLPEEAPSNLAITGRYILEPQIMTILSETKPGKGGEIQLTDALKILSEKSSIYGYKFDGIRYDIGSKVGLIEATLDFALKRDDLKEEVAMLLDKIIKKRG